MDGNAHIATEYALKTILKLVEDFKISSILEVGLGIGSISDTVFKYADIKNRTIEYAGTEANEFCLDALKQNVISNDKIDLYSELSDISQTKKYDLIIVDGSDASLKSIAAYAKEDSIIYVEGWRGSQVAQIKDVFPNCAHVEIISSYKNPQYGPFDAAIWAGGGQLIFINPNLGRKAYWFKEKVGSFLKRRIRKFK